MPDAFQQALVGAIAGGSGDLSPWLARGADDPALAVYRNTVAKGRADALAALFPAVERLVGPDWFREAALAFAREHPPTGPVLDDWGADFPGWLERFGPARDHPYLAPAARLDLAWSAAHRAPDAPVLEMSDISALPPHRLFAARAVLHPSARLFSFDWTAPSLWLANRPELGLEGDLVWEPRPEALAVLRPRWTVIAIRLHASQRRVLDACARGQSLGQAVLFALGAPAAADPVRLLASLLEAGLFTRLETLP